MDASQVNNKILHTSFLFTSEDDLTEAKSVQKGD